MIEDNALNSTKLECVINHPKERLAYTLTMTKVLVYPASLHQTLSRVSYFLVINPADCNLDS